MTLSVTRFRTSVVLAEAARIVAVGGWEPLRQPVMHAIDQAAGFVPGNGSADAEETTIQAFEALSDHLACPADRWERTPGRSAFDVVNALRDAAKAVTS